MVSIKAVLAAAIFAMGSASSARAEPRMFDLVIYGGTPAGVIAAVQTQRMGKQALLIEPTQHLGGMTSGGLGATDIGNKQAIGGLAREFYRGVRRHYAETSPETRALLEDFARRRPSAVDDDTLWMFEPHVAEAVLLAMLNGSGATLALGERLDLKQGVRMQGSRIASVVMESGREFSGRMFIDASYEGDLLALAGVSHAIGREANAKYDETLNGVQVERAVHHQFTHAVDPYVKPGEPASGLLPGVLDRGPGADGEGDARVQAYNFRLCTTNEPENRLPWPKPADYDPRRYELLLRNFEAGDRRVPWNPVEIPSHKTDTNNNYAISTDNIGQNDGYATGDYATREHIIAEHRAYQMGLMWTLANDPRVPTEIRREFQTWGLARDEFVDNDHWPRQLYVREARRMVSDYVMTEHDCRWQRMANDSVGLAAYGMDSHHTQRYVDSEGHARNEGDVQAPVAGPFPIAYRAVAPPRGQCENLLVPVCLSASHIAYGSIRMEPVFMVLGQSCATAAVLAIESDAPVQSVDYAQLRKRLLADGQTLDRPQRERAK